MNNLTDEFFSDYLEQFHFISDHISTYGTCPDMITLVNKFPDFDVIEVKEPMTYLLQELYADRNKRKLAEIFNKVRTLLNQDKTEEAMLLYTNAAQEMVSCNRMECVDILRDTSRYEDYVQKCQDYDKFYIKTGFPELDELIGGWDRYEELATIVARPNIGKSFILQKMALAAAEQGLNVGLYSGEMSENKVGFRIDSLLSHISNSGIMRGKDYVQVEYKKYIEELPGKIKGSLKVLTPVMINGTAGVTALRAFIEKEKLDVLFVDQHSLLDDDRGAKNPVERASNISKDLKNLQVLKKIPIIAVSQQNRSSIEEGAGPGTENVAQTDRIAQDSTILIFLQRSEDTLTLNLVKCRDSANGKKLSYAVDLDKGIFRFIPTEGTNQEGVQQLYEEFETDGEDAF